jgi:hypothetical protein
MNDDHETPSSNDSLVRSVRARRSPILQLFILVRRNDAARIALCGQFAGADALAVLYRVIGFDFVGFEAGGFVVAVGHGGLRFVLA